MKPFNRPQIPFALAKLLGVTTGDFSLQVGEDLSPIVIAADLTDTPYTGIGVPVVRDHTGAAVAAQNAFVIAQPGPTNILQIDEIEVSNESGAPLIVIHLILSAADVAALATAPNNARAMQQTASGMIDPTTYAPSSATLSRAAHAASIGNGIGRQSIMTADSKVYHFPKPGLLLFGNDPNGIPAYAARNGTAVNATITATVKGRLWPLPA